MKKYCVTQTKRTVRENKSKENHQKRRKKVNQIPKTSTTEHCEKKGGPETSEKQVNINDNRAFKKKKKEVYQKSNDGELMLS